MALVSTLLSASVAQASSGALTEAVAILIFLEQSPQARRLPLVERSVDAALRTEARVRNPDVAYQVEDAAGIRDEFLRVAAHAFRSPAAVDCSTNGQRSLLQPRASPRNETFKATCSI